MKKSLIAMLSVVLFGPAVAQAQDAENGAVGGNRADAQAPFNQELLEVVYGSADLNSMSGISRRIQVGGINLEREGYGSVYWQMDTFDSTNLNSMNRLGFNSGWSWSFVGDNSLYAHLDLGLFLQWLDYDIDFFDRRDAGYDGHIQLGYRPIPRLALTYSYNLDHVDGDSESGTGWSASYRIGDNGWGLKYSQVESGGIQRNLFGFHVEL